MKPLNLAVATGITLDVAGALHVYGLADAKGVNREVITATLLLAIAGLWLLVRPGRRDMEDDRPAVWVALLPAMAAVLSISDIMTYVATGWTLPRAILFGGATILLLLLALRHASSEVVALAAFVVGSVLRYLNMRHIPIEPARGDMLPLVQQAIASLTGGRDPYTIYSMPWQLPLTYLPLTWLAYAPTYLLGLDLRWTNVVAEVGLLAALGFVGRRSENRRGEETALLLWAWLFLSPTVIHWDLTTTAPIGWTAIAWTLALAATSRRTLATISLGVSAAVSPLIVIFAPLIVLCWWRAEGPAGAARRAILAALLAGALLLPWFLWGPGPFLDGTVRWFNDLNRFPRMKWQTEHTWAEITGFSGLFWLWGLERLLKPIQAAAVILVTTIFAVRGARPADLGRHAAAAFLLFMLFNPVLWPYLYNPALVAGLLAVAGAGVLESIRPAAASAAARRPSARGHGKKRFSDPTI